MFIKFEEKFTKFELFKETYLIIFADIKGSQKLLENQMDNFIRVLSNFFLACFQLTEYCKERFSITEDLFIKLVGDGFLLLVPIMKESNNRDIENSKYYTFFKCLSQKILTQNIFPIRIVGGIGELQCLKLSENYQECIGYPLNFLIKNSKKNKTKYILVWIHQKMKI